MDVLTGGKRFLQIRIVGDVCHDAKFDLRIVGRDYFSLGRDKGLAHPSTRLGAHRNVL